ncbi:MAG: LON peptidase substrate-binding domain-containing protein [Thermoleophilaceae bacterium]
MSLVSERFPLFPLGLVLVPSEVVPLHIFEERYRRMIGECLAENTEFGIVWLSEQGLRDVGCGARITEVLDRLDDGRLNILVEGTRPFRLLRRIGDMPYPAADVEFLEQIDDADPELRSDARERYGDLVERITEERPPQDELSELDAYRMAATIEFDLSAKQGLLELRSEEDRLRMMGDLLRSTASRLEEAKRAGELAKSNGKIRF